MKSTKRKVSSASKPSHDSEISEQANRVLDESKKLGVEIYHHGKDKIDDLQEQIHIHTDTITQKVREKPISSLLVATGVGFIIARILNH